MKIKISKKIVAGFSTPSQLKRQQESPKIIYSQRNIKKSEKTLYNNNNK